MLQPRQRQTTHCQKLARKTALYFNFLCNQLKIYFQFSCHWCATHLFIFHKTHERRGWCTHFCLVLSSCIVTSL